ncbi:hypothetical protein O9G_005080 [Rozella allomycis CSF55]|uniref:Uncharacterized protein n=1 Tax=Rozella allomycis (strain CSF55) TaxID=988480 RepID=A0A075B2A3_ROZAC|nr:hypothetical protein O9G_005080 [Rozella allomycis CSF55]|eukprot:EPZ36710.1 hypothetical protein O9G_005080 [Rozella allomycis CSF55]
MTNNINPFQYYHENANPPVRFAKIGLIEVPDSAFVTLQVLLRDGTVKPFSYLMFSMFQTDGFCTAEDKVTGEILLEGIYDGRFYLILL